MADLLALQIPAAQDNYIYLLRDTALNQTAVVDPTEAEPVLAVLKRRGWKLHYILNTHHHADHVGGNLMLKAETGCRIIAGARDKDRIPGIDYGVSEGEKVLIGESVGHVYEIPGHTLGHVAFYFPETSALFCGDTLFSLGCGRLFEGTAAQMWTSLKRLRTLPDDTRVHCAHEYTLANARFALHLDPENPLLKLKAAQANVLRMDGRPTVPSLLGEEKVCNPFLRADDEFLREELGMLDAPDEEVFAEIRTRKDHFKPVEVSPLI